MEFLKQISAGFSRRKFMLTAALTLGGLASWKTWIRPPQVPRTIKMLTRTGHLVEVDVRHLPKKSLPVSMQQLKQWVWKKQDFNQQP